MPKRPTSISKTTAQTPPPIAHMHLPLIEVSEAWLLDMMLADTNAARFIVARIADRVAIIAPGQIDSCLARLRKLGHTPRVLEE